MANVRNVYQTTDKVSIPKQEFLERIVYEDSLTKDDLRVIMLLLTELGGYSEPANGKNQDPENFKEVDPSWIAKKLQIKKKKAKAILEDLVDLYILEPGSSRVVKNGYRFTF